MGNCVTEDHKMKDFHQTMQSMIDECEDDFYAGNKMALFDAIQICAEAMPSWINQEINAALWKYNTAESKELGEAFGIERNKGFTQSAEYKNRRYPWYVWLFIQERHLKFGEPIDQAIFDAAGEKFIISGRKARDYYYMYKDSLKLP